MSADHGQTATELAEACTALTEALAGSTLADVVSLDDRDDLLLFVERGDQDRHAVHVAPGGKRARLTTTRRRFPRRRFATGPRPDRLRELLVGARLERVEAVAGERRCTLHLIAADDRQLALQVELFGPRGLWAVTDETGRILVLSRLPQQKDRTLRPGAPYQPPAAPATADRRPEPESRFGAPVLETTDAHFTAADEADERDARRSGLVRTIERARRKARSRLQGARAQLEAAGRADEIRRLADLVLAYGYGAPEGATELRVPSPDDPGGEMTIPLDPRLAPHQQAEKLYDKARKHQDGAEVAAARAAAAERELTGLDALLADLERLSDGNEGSDPESPEQRATARQTLERIERDLVDRGLVRPTTPAKPRPAEQKLRKLTGGENFRRFESREGLMMLVGRDGRQNDRLVTRVARGNDLWFHVGRGYAGSHVLVRVPKNRSASLDTLLDAGTLAIHFSKVRGAELEEVVYCPAKNVRKPKGMPAGSVVPSRTKSLRIRREPDRLKRLLESAGDDERR